MFDAGTIRAEFPALQQEVHGKPLVYLDNAATTQKPRVVIDAIRRYYEHDNANIHRGVHALSERATAMYEQAREAVRGFIHAKSVAEVIFTRNATESINIVARAWGDANVRAGDEVLITAIEHHSNIVPWQMLRDERGIVLRYIPMLPDGTLDLEAARRLIGPKTKLLSITAMSNALGTIVPLHEIIPLAKAQGATVLVDGAQSVPHLAVDVQALGADFLAFSGHKMLGPTGIGVLWGRFELLDAMQPFLGGGDMILTVSMERSTWAEVPAKFEAGTPNIADAIGLGAAVDYLAALGMDAVRRHEVEITDYALRRLADVPGVTIFGPMDAEQRGGVVSFELEGVHPHDVGQVLDTKGVAIRTGHHCAQPVMAALQVPATARASFYIYNTTEEVDTLASAIESAAAFFGGR